MARNRKRAKERRSRRPAAPASRPGVATTREPRNVDGPSPLEQVQDPGAVEQDNGALEEDDGALEQDDRAPEQDDALEQDETPSPLEHAAPDVELADAQLALGRPELAGDANGEPEPEGFDEQQEFEQEVEASVSAADRSNGGDGARGLELASTGAEAPAARQLPGHRLINFLKGSWRELQRVQWPDRRQVVQATGVVIGFVIVAGIYLGVADTLSTKIVNFLLK